MLEVLARQVGRYFDIQVYFEPFLWRMPMSPAVKIFTLTEWALC